MSEWWTANGELVLGIVLGGIVGVVIQWYFHRRAEKPKRLGWELVSSNRIISASEYQRKNLLVTYMGREVENPHVLCLRIVNTGKQEVRASDFIEPISFDFGHTEPS
jgi:hypothetical protein